jgi:hypothetical protein
MYFRIRFLPLLPAFATLLFAQGIPPPPPVDLYLLMGQSNMVGRDTAGLGEQTPDLRILSWTTIGSSPWRAAREPLNADGSGMGPGIPFAAALLAASGVSADTVIGLVQTAVGGTPLRRWVKGGDLYEKAVFQARAALRAAQAVNPAARLRGVLWHQGESDCENKNDADTYEARLVKMFTDLRADLADLTGATAMPLPVVIGQLGDFVSFAHTETVRAALRNMPARLPAVAFVDAAGLPDKGDRLHFTAAAQQELGRRYAAAMRKLEATP